MWIQRAMMVIGAVTSAFILGTGLVYLFGRKVAYLRASDGY